MPAKKPRRSILTVHDPEILRVAYAIEQLILEYEAELADRKRLDNGRRAYYLEQLAIITHKKSVTQSMFSKMVSRYQSHRVNVSDEPPINALIPNQGPPRKQRLTAKQAKFAIGAYTRRKRSARLSTGVEKAIKSKPDLEEVHYLLQTTFPDYQETLESLRAFFTEFEIQNPTLAKRMRSDDHNQIDTQQLGKKQHVPPPDELWWTVDGRRLPNFIRIDNFACKVEIVPTIDMRYGAVLGYRIVPTKRLNEQGKIEKIGWTQLDLRFSLGAAILFTNHRPHIAYGDQGSQMKEINLSLLTYNAEPATRYIPARRQSPTGHGKGERIQALLDYIAARLPGYFDDSDHPFPKNPSAKELKDLCDLEQFIGEVERRIRDWNTMIPEGETLSRIELYWTQNSIALTRPSPIHLGLFSQFYRYEEKAILDNDGVTREYTQWQNKWTNDDAYTRFSCKVGATIPFCMLMLDGRLRAFGVLDPTYGADGWEEFVPRSENATISATRYHRYQKHARETLSKQQRDYQAYFEATVIESFGRVPAVDVHTKKPYTDPPALVDHQSNTNEENTPIPHQTPEEKVPLLTQQPSKEHTKRSSSKKQTNTPRTQPISTSSDTTTPADAPTHHASIPKSTFAERLRALRGRDTAHGDDPA